MNKLFLLGFFVALFSAGKITAQDLPHWMTEEERALLPSYLINTEGIRDINPPAFTPRASAEWEEIQGLTITWTSYTSILKPIVDAAQEECKVYIVCTDSNSVKSSLASSGIPLTNVKFLVKSFNSIWCRDYGPWNIYKNDVEQLSLTDWIYNRPRPKDDVIPGALATLVGLPMYEMTVAPHDLVATGGNFMVDGHNTAFSSELILDENGPGNDYDVTVKTKADIDTILKKYLGVNRYITMETLPFDEIHHIDMHMKLLDEETLLVGEFPAGVADGPQIEANIQYVQNNYLNCFGRPYKIVRVPMPPSTSGQYVPNTYYRTYTNSVIVNKTVILPTYRQQYDTTAIRIYKENMPGYKIVPIDCDDGGSPIISALGAIHCITKEIAAGDPVWISHSPLQNRNASVNPILVEAKIKTPSDVSEASLFWSVDTAAGYNEVAMTAAANDTFYAYIPAQNAATKVFYYLHAVSNSGRSISKPMTAPAGYWEFEVKKNRTYGNPVYFPVPEYFYQVKSDVNGNDSPMDAFVLYDPYPNPAANTVTIGFTLPAAMQCSVLIRDVLGRTVAVLSGGELAAGIHKFKYSPDNISPGLYFVEVHAGDELLSKKFMLNR
ncbi:MAG TPA: agmatine deiminase family protein [Chitinophagales bacterium]|nr:agmatine deiminase family protein [Chitinophagales bacterium]